MALALLAALPGCTKYNKRVPDKMLEKLPYESRIELLEAENDYALAIDHVDEAENEIHRTRDSIRRAKDRLKAAKNETSAAGDQVSADVAALAVAEADARVEYLRAKQDVNVKNQTIAQTELRCAAARFEKARVEVVRKAKIEGSESLSTQEFEQQVKDCEAEVAARKEALKEQTSAMAAAKDGWEKQKQALAKKTFDARASPYVE